MIKQKGITIIESLISTVLATTIILSGTYAITEYSENKDLDDRASTTASQIIEFTKASEQLLVGIGGFDKDQITIDDLKSYSLLENSFPEQTPYGQEIQAYIIENPNDSSFKDVLVSTYGEPDVEYVDRSGHTEDTFNTIQQKVYESMRRTSIDINGQYQYGIISNSEFSSAGRLFVRDVSAFNSDFGEHSQPSVLLITPDKTIDLVPQVQAIQSVPSDNIPANNISESVISVSVRYQDGTPVTNSEVLWNSSGGTLSSPSTLTNNKGIATVRIKSGIAGIVSINARVSENNANSSTSINFVPPDITSLSATPTTNVNADGVMCSNFIADLSYADGTIANNEPVEWITNIGTYKTKQVKTNTSGKTTACLVSSTEGIANARLKASRSGVIENKSIQFVGPRINNGAMWASPSSAIPADGSDYSRVTVRATYPNGKRASGITINWSTNRGWLNATQTITNSSGETSVVLRSNQAGNAIVVAKVPTGQSRSITIGFDAARVVNIYANRTSEIPADGSSSSTVSAVLQYPNGKKAISEIVSWSTSFGNLSNSQTRTNSSGIASTYISSKNAGTATVRASYGGTSRAINISFKNNQVCKPNDKRQLIKYSGGNGLLKPASSCYFYCNSSICGIQVGLVFQCKADGSEWVFSTGSTGALCYSTRDMSKVDNQDIIPIEHYTIPLP